MEVAAICVARRGIRRSWLLLLAALASACQAIPPEPLDAEGLARDFEARTLSDPELHRFVARALGEPFAENGEARWDARTLGAAALWFRPSLALAAARTRRAEAAIRSAGAWPNPTLAVAPEYAMNGSSGISPWIAGVHFDWLLETAGKRGHRIDQARARALAAHYAFETEAWKIRSEVASAAIELEATQKRIAALEPEVAAQSALVEAWRERVSLGAASSAQAAPAEAAFLDTTRDAAAEHAHAVSAAARLASALGVPSREVRELALAPADFSALAGISRDEALAGALVRRSDLLAALADYAGAEAALALELARQYPDLHLGPGYQFDQSVNKWSIGLSVDLPLLDQNQGPIAEAEAAREEAAASFLTLQADAIMQIELALARRDGAGAARNAFEAVADERERNAGRAEHALARGAVSRPDALAARVEALRARRAAIDAAAVWQQAVAELDAALQATPIDAGAVRAHARLAAWDGVP